jgi:putative ABC transport system permease protein
MQSPYDPVMPTLYYITRSDFGYLNIRISPEQSMQEALSKVEQVYHKYSPSEPFAYRFADDDYAIKFSNEERTGKLAGLFTLLAIVISCTGLFGMASFMAEQRIKELGVRKVMGASVFGLWKLMSSDFMIMSFIAVSIAMPVAGVCMNSWLEHFNYHTVIRPEIYAGTGIGTMFITLLTVSYQSLKAALTNPVKSLRTE